MVQAENSLVNDIDIEHIKALGSGIDVLVSPVLLYGPDGDVLYANAAARRYWPILIGDLEKGIPRKDAVERQIRNLAPHFPKEILDAEVQKTLDLFLKDEPDELYGAENKWFRIEHHKTDSGNIVGIGVDISEMKESQVALIKARKEAVAANKAKSEFLANMSHEIRTPMNGILGIADMLVKMVDNDQQREFMNIILRSSEALLTIINDILDFSKIEAGQMTFERQSFSLQDCVEDVAAVLEHKVAEKNIEFIIRYDPALPKNFMGDAGRIRQIILNLAGNGVKFTDHGHVLVDVSGEETSQGKFHLKIDISDSGIGIPTAKLEKIFQKFSQADESTTRKYGGTGLGLSISRGLAEMMDGNVSAVSKEGAGSTFTVQLPLEVSNVVTAKAATLPSNFKIEGNILFVDDNDINHSVIKGQLSDQPARVVCVDSAKRAMLLLEQTRSHNIEINCLILDYQMPEISGIDFIQILEDHKESWDIPIIILSSSDIPQDDKDRLGTRVSFYLKKPCKESQIKRALHDCLNPGSKALRAIA